MENFYIIDGNSLINRAFYALPLLTNSSGEYSNAVYGFCNILTKLITENKVDFLAVAFDLKEPTFRHKMCDFYKATRKGMPEELASQMPILKDMLRLMNITIIERAGFEADDILGTLSRQFDVNFKLITGDKDALQLINPNTEVLLTRKGITDIERFDESHLYEKMGIKPYQIVELKALMGDASDNIPGVSGVGEKTAINLIQTYDNVENIYSHIDEIKGKLHEKLINSKDMAFLSKTLATIKTDIDLEYNLDEFKFDFPFSNEVFEFFKKYEFKSLLKRKEIFKNDIEFPKSEEKFTSIKKIETENQLEDLIENLTNFNPFSFVFDKDIHFCNSNFEEIVVSIKKDMLDCGFDLEFALNKLKNLFENPKIKKICFDYKTIKHNFDNLSINLQGVIFDSQLADYLIKSGRTHAKNVKDFALNFGFNENSLANSLFVMQKKQLEELEKLNMTNLYFNIEFPLIDVLYNMENAGFMLNRKALVELNEEYNKELESLTQQIYAIVGSEFNINSPKQVSNILFNVLGLKNKSKGSTNINILEDIEDEHPVIPLIIRYRKIYKLNSTYVLTYLEKTSKQNSIVHTIFNQTLTSTGRLSSTEPNLQNIPIKQEEGKLLRKMFISRFADGKIISSDYNQIELRLLAHFSGDEKLLSAFNNNQDIHSKTASEIFNVKIEDVIPLMRRNAKAVNFGIIYGISEFGLAKTIHSTRSDAKIFMDKYLETYKGVADYMEKSKEIAKQNGYVSTLFNRRRIVDDIYSTNRFTKNFAERVSLNMPLQGTASDIIKIAMINVFNKMNEKKLKSKLILQIHDELIVDATPDEVSIVEKILKTEMENAVNLKVKLTVEINAGNNLYDAK